MRMEQLGQSPIFGLSGLIGSWRHLSQGAVRISCEVGRDEQHLPKAFDEAMVSIYRRALAETGYRATYFLRMVHDQGGLETARQLLRTPTPSDGFVKLWEKRRLDLSVEYHVLLPQYRELFDPEEREIARRRLRDYGFDVDRLGDAGAADGPT